MDTNAPSLETEIASLLDRTKEDAGKLDVTATLGSIQGGNLLVDGFDIPIPLSDVSKLMHWQYTQGQSKDFELPEYKNGDRVLLVPTTDSHFIIVGKVG